MNKYYQVLCLFGLVLSFSARSQYSRYIILLKNKNGSPYSISNPSAYLSSRAIARRNRYKIAIDSTDLPVNPAYLDSIRAVPNVVVLNVSKWLNQVCIKTTDPTTALATINAFSFVRSSNPIAVRLMQSPSTEPSAKFEEFSQQPVPLRVNDIMSPFGITGTQDFYNYGSNFGQVHIHEGEYLHDLGFHGEGMTIAMLDAGFNNYLFNPAFDSLRLNNQVLGTYDYVASEQSVNEDNGHGAYCLSIMAANEPGKIVGTAPKAKYWLLRTEDVATEYPVEEQNWVAAAEFADSAGVDLITTSLGYSSFDDHSFDHSYAQRDGKTAISSIGASLAVKKGILVTASAGNSGTSTTDAKYVGVPADADSVFTIGSTDVNGNISSFSSWGPNGAGSLKPNVVSVGGPAVAANLTTGNPITGNGTSFSNPNLCGLIACLWQAFPAFSNREIMDAVQRSSSKYANPDYHFGYGIPNMRLAYLDLQQQQQQRQQQQLINYYQQVLGNNWIKAYPVPFTSNLSVLLKAPATGNSSLRLIDMNGKTIEIKNTQVQQNTIYTISFDKLKLISRGVYTVQYNDGKNRTSLRVIKQ